MSTIGSDLTSSFTIRELTGDKRSLTLRERALPYRPFELRGRQRNAVDWYQGSPVGTLQVFGASEEPTTISGAWKDKYLGGVPGSAAAELASDGPGGSMMISDGQGGTIESEIISTNSSVIQSTRELVELVDDMRRKGQEVEVTWLNKTRRGIIDMFTERWMTGHDCEWEIVFVWISQGEDLNSISMQSDASDLGDLPNMVQSRVDETVDDVASLVPQSGDRFAEIGASLSNATNRLQEFAEELTDMVSQSASMVTAPGQAVRRTVGILDGLKFEAENMRMITERMGDAVCLDATELQSFGESLRDRARLRERGNSAGAITNLAAREQSKLLANVDGDVLRIFQARDGQDLREVSRVHYGTTDEWRSLMIYNRLTTSRLTAGQVVFVPARPTDGGR